ncbi:MAG: polyribonucleotide nucleotidyltransferase [Omnitrophica WOR_2 bacterium GWF2_43_52]|nr:MAG: polyribonucleotide nucleotidyltransferase [Omnitrophica WOR_2 bacterium GWC2_44_8]OGX21342.1 MAG: polyribonucleotide nucleotidyltransferase [Omnitrophica WOR_2 bacterium GWF2_43_52]HAH22037.1 polyribonucleotide nucleotidyltransferase [Candidatus Omnitrophota bacterium]HBG62714.1 polyribonucleotide nucleotidyltransferase [Candidatus Omnitrophota bacterium]
MELKQVSIKCGRQDVLIETGKIAKQANGAVVVSCGGTVVLVTACMSKRTKESLGFFPLTVEYQEKTYAAGRIPGGFFKREGRPSESEILAARLIDRPIRPLFSKGITNEVQVIAIVLSSDGENDPDVLAVNGASAALSISDIPFNGPIGAVRVGYIDNGFVINPTYAEIAKSSLDLVVAANKSGVMMIESKLKEVPEDLVLEALRFGFTNIQGIIQAQDNFVKQVGKEKAVLEYKKIDEKLYTTVESLAKDRLSEICLLSGKEQREEAVSILAKELDEKLTGEDYESQDIRAALEEVEKRSVRNYILEKGVRVDNRGPYDIRPITCEIGVLPRTHGSGLFTRGQTQSLAVTTLGSSADEQLVEALEGETSKSFMLHYSFPPFSVGETAPLRGPGRREIGHGALAEKALAFVMPLKEEFPYTVRVVSEILESNGSSSMATVCASTLSLMDAGVPIKKPVAGIAMGLIKEGPRSIIVTDISGIEDHFGDMDFKVAGTRDGITAIQLDLKTAGIDLALIATIISDAKNARLIVLDKMQQAITRPREELSAFAPRITILKISTDKIGELIGPGGKNIKKIISTTGASVDIEDDGSVFVASNDSVAAQKAIDMIKGLTEAPEVGKIYSGKIKRIMAFGAFCEILPNKEGLIHVSELADKFVKNVEDVVKIGDEVKVKIVGIDELGRVNLSIKQVVETKA